MSLHDPETLEVCGCLFEPAGHQKNWSTGEMNPVWHTPDIREHAEGGQEVSAILARSGVAEWRVGIRGLEASASTPNDAFQATLRLLEADHRALLAKRAARALVTAVHVEAYGAWRCGEPRDPDNGDWIGFMEPSKRFCLVTCVACLGLQITWAEKHQRDQLKELSRALRQASQLELA